MSKLAIPARSQLHQVLVGIAYFALFAWWSYDGIETPLGNWDMFGYVAASAKGRMPDAEIRPWAIGQIEDYLGPEKAKRLHQGNEYARSVAQSDAALNAQIPAYSVKVLYVGLVALLNEVGINAARATVMVSAAGLVVLSVALWLVRPSKFSVHLWVIGIVGTMLLQHPPLSALAAAATPDSLAASLLFLGIYGIYRDRPSLPFATVCFSAMILARQDFIVTFIAVLPFVLYSMRSESKSKMLIAVAAPIAVYLISRWFFPGFPWSTLIDHTFLGPFTLPEDPHPHVDLELYLTKLYENCSWLLQQPRPIIAILAGLFVITRSVPAGQLLALGSLSNLAVRILLFPNIDGGNQERYYFASYFLVLISLALVLSRNQSARR